MLGISVYSKNCYLNGNAIHYNRERLVPKEMRDRSSHTICDISPYWETLYKQKFTLLFSFDFSPLVCYMQRIRDVRLLYKRSFRLLRFTPIKQKLTSLYCPSLLNDDNSSYKD